MHKQFSGELVPRLVAKQTPIECACKICGEDCCQATGCVLIAPSWHDKAEFICDFCWHLMLAYTQLGVEATGGQEEG